MLRRTTHLLTLALAALVLVPALAHAATPNQIYRDAEDGSIDGNYSLADLRAADGQISADAREYNLWDEIYAAAIARINNPNAPKPPKLTIVKPVDTNGNGTIDDAEVQAAIKKSKALNKKQLDEIDDIVEDVDGNGTDADDDVEVIDSAKTNDSSDADDDDGGVAWPLIILLLLVLAIAGVAAWRVYTAKRKPGVKRGPGAKPTSESKPPRRKKRK